METVHLEKKLKQKNFCELVGIPPNNAHIIKEHKLFVYDTEDPKLVLVEDTIRRIIASTYFKKHHPKMKQLLLRGFAPVEEGVKHLDTNKIAAAVVDQLLIQPITSRKKVPNKAVVGVEKECAKEENIETDDVIIFWRSFFRDVASEAEAADTIMREGIQTAKAWMGNSEKAQDLKYATDSLRVILRMRKESATLISTAEAMGLVGFANEQMITGMRDIISKFCVENNLDINANAQLNGHLMNLIQNIRTSVPAKIDEFRTEKK